MTSVQRRLLKEAQAMTGEQFVQMLKQQVKPDSIAAAKRMGLKLFAHPDKIVAAWGDTEKSEYPLDAQGVAGLAREISTNIGYSAPSSTKLAGEPGGRQRRDPYSDPDD